MQPALGDVNLLSRVRDLSALLEDQKQANVQLTAENQLLKRTLLELQQRLTALEAGRQQEEEGARLVLRFAHTCK
jgi:hypothetical protein